MKYLYSPVRPAHGWPRGHQTGKPATNFTAARVYGSRFGPRPPEACYVCDIMNAELAPRASGRQEARGGAAESACKLPGCQLPGTPLPLGAS